MKQSLSSLALLPIFIFTYADYSVIQESTNRSLADALFNKYLVDAQYSSALMFTHTQKIAQLLLDHGAEPLITDKYENNALYYAYHNYQRAFLDKKWALAAKQEDDYAKAYATERDYAEYLCFLLEHMTMKGQIAADTVHFIEKQYSKNLIMIIQEMVNDPEYEINKMFLATNRSFAGLGEISHDVLLKELGITINQNSALKTHVHTVLFKTAHFDTIKLLLNLNVDMTMVDEDGNSPLYYVYADYQDRLELAASADEYGSNGSYEHQRAIDECKKIIILLLDNMTKGTWCIHKSQEHFEKIIDDIEKQYSASLRRMLP